MQEWSCPHSFTYVSGLLRLISPIRSLFRATVIVKETVNFWFCCSCKHLVWSSVLIWTLVAVCYVCNCHHCYSCLSRPVSHTSALYINANACAVEPVLRMSRTQIWPAFHSGRIFAHPLTCSGKKLNWGFELHCVWRVLLFVVPKPAAGTPPWTPAALVWTAPPPICNTQQRGGSVTTRPGPPGATKQVSGHTVGIILRSQITQCPWQWGVHTQLHSRHFAPFSLVPSPLYLRRVQSEASEREQDSIPF